MSSKITITRRDQGQIILRAKLDAAADAFKAGGLKAPEPLMRTSLKAGAVHWFSPDEALIFADEPAKIIAKMAKELPPHHLIHETTGARVVFTISGAHLRDMLAKGAPRDLRQVEINEVVRTRLGQVAVAFWFIDETTVELVCFRSVADYVEKWLEIAAHDDGLPVLG